jgi:hypothetical protein
MVKLAFVAFRLWSCVVFSQWDFGPTCGLLTQIEARPNILANFKWLEGRSLMRREASHAEMGFGDPDRRISSDNSTPVRDRYAAFPGRAEGRFEKPDRR